MTRPQRRRDDFTCVTTRWSQAKAVKEALEKEEVTVDSFDAKGDTLLHVIVPDTLAGSCFAASAVVDSGSA